MHNCDIFRQNAFVFKPCFDDRFNRRKRLLLLIDASLGFWYRCLRTNTFVVSNKFAAVLQVNDTLEVATAGAHDYSLQASTKVASIATATSTTKTITMDKTSEAASGSDTRVAEAGVTQLKVTGAAFDAEKMTMDSLASGLAVKVKGDTFKRNDFNTTIDFFCGVVHDI